MESGSADTEAFAPPRRIGRYQIVGELGRGAMGVVHKGYDPTIGRTVAIKTVLASSTNEELLKRFRREAQAAGVLSHPHIVTIYDAGEDQGIFYIAMEYVEGETLEKIIARGPLPIDDVIRIIEDVGSALDHAHKREIIHRDIKPPNIMISAGRAKVMDFGVARLISSTATATGMVIGTPSYMSPEGVKGLPVDGRADIFSLGVVLYEMITGKRPFAGDSIPSVIYKILGEEPAPPTTLNPALHNGLDIVLAKALAKETDDRYGTCAELIKDLKNFRFLKAPSLATATASPAAKPRPDRTLAPPLVSGTVAITPNTIVSPPPTLAAAPPAPQRPVPSVQADPPRKSWLAPLLIVAVLAAATIGGAVWWQHRQAAERARQEEAARAAETARQAQRQAATNAVKPSPTGEPAPPSAPAVPVSKEKPAGEEKAEKAPPPVAPVEGRLRILTFPPNAEVVVDGKVTTYRTPVNMLLPSGRHKISLKHKRTSDYSREMVVVANEIVELSVNLLNPDKPLPFHRHP